MPPKARPRPQDHSRKQPAPKPPAAGVFDLDALERDSDAPDVLTVQIGGEQFTFIGPEDVDWQEAGALDLDDIPSIMRVMLGDQYEAFTRHRLPLWKLKALGKKVTEHYGLGEDDASPS